MAAPTVQQLEVPTQAATSKAMPARKQAPIQETMTENLFEQVEGDDEHGVEEDGAAHQSVVPVKGGRNELPSEARNLEDGLDDERA